MPALLSGTNVTDPIFADHKRLIGNRRDKRTQEKEMRIGIQIAAIEKTAYLDLQEDGTFSCTQWFWWCEFRLSAGCFIVSEFVTFPAV